MHDTDCVCVRTGVHSPTMCVRASFQALAPIQEKTKSVYATYSFRRRFYAKRLVVQMHIFINMLLAPWNKTAVDPKIKEELCLFPASASHG